MDQQLQSAKRDFEADPKNNEAKSRYLLLLLRKNNLETEEIIRYCSSLGDPVARSIFPEEEVKEKKIIVKGVTTRRGIIEETLHKMRSKPRENFKKECVLATLYCTDLISPYLHEYKGKDNERVEKAEKCIEAVRKWLKLPSGSNAREAYSLSQFSTGTDLWGAHLYSWILGVFTSSASIANSSNYRYWVSKTNNIFDMTARIILKHPLPYDKYPHSYEYIPLRRKLFCNYLLTKIIME